MLPVHLYLFDSRVKLSSQMLNKLYAEDLGLLAIIVAGSQRSLRSVCALLAHIKNALSFCKRKKLNALFVSIITLAIHPVETTEFSMCNDLTSEQ